MLLIIDIFGYTSLNYGRHNIILYPDKLNMYEFNVAPIYGIPLVLLWNSYSLAAARIACEKRRLQRNVWRKDRAKYMCGPVGLL